MQGIKGVEINLQNGGKQSKQMQTLNGKLRIERTVYRPEIEIKDETGNTHFTMKGAPLALLDKYLDIDKLPFKMTA
jgi:hypothetical protein